MSLEPQPGPSTGSVELNYVHRKGGIILLHAGHQYTKKTTYKSGSSIWECYLRKKIKCTGTITIQQNNIIKETSHVCAPDLNKNMLDSYIEEIKNKIVSADVPAIPTAYNTMLSDIKDTGLDKVIELPKFERKKTSLYHHRNTTFGVDKTVFDDPEKVSIPPKYKHFVLADYFESETKTRIILFCSEEARNKMSYLKDFLGDGTFKSCPRAFKQIYTIHADESSDNESTKMTPLVYALLNNKKKTTYEIVYRLIKSQIPEWNPSSFTCDFEEGNISAIKEVFPNIDVHGCYYHYNKAVWKKGRELGLTKSKVLRRQVALSAVLPLLPLERIIEGWFYIAGFSPDDSQSTIFRKYMLSQWLRPNFIEVWCCFDRRHRTNNFVEGWHCKLNNAVGKKTPTLIKLLTVLYQDANLFSIKANQPSKRRLKTSIEYDNFIQECQVKLLNNELTSGHYLEILR